LSISENSRPPDVMPTRHLSDIHSVHQLQCHCIFDCSYQVGAVHDRPKAAVVFCQYWQVFIFTDASLICLVQTSSNLHIQQAVGGRPPRCALTPLLPPWAPKRLAPPSRRQRSNSFPLPTRSHAQPPDAPTRGEQSGLVTLTFWPWKWCPSHVWRSLPLCQFWYF